MNATTGMGQNTRREYVKTSDPDTNLSSFNMKRLNRSKTATPSNQMTIRAVTGYCPYTATGAAMCA